MSCLKQFALAVGSMLLGSLFQVLGPTYDSLCIPEFGLQIGNFNFLLQKRVATPLSSTRQKTSLKIVRTVIVVKFKNVRYNEL